MKIIQIITSSKCWAGMEQYAFDVSKELIARGHEVVFVIANDGDVVWPRFQELGKVYLLPLKSKFDFKSVRELKKIIRAENPDIIHTHQPKNIFHAHWGRNGNKRIKIVHTVHFLINPTSPQALYSWIFGKVDRIIAVSDIARQRVLEIYPKIDKTKVVAVLSSIDSSRFEVAPKEPNHDECVTIGYAGRLVEEKGVGVLLKAASRLKQNNTKFSLVIAGTGSDQYVEELKRMAADFGIENDVEFLGFVNDMNQFMKKIDIAVVPSIVREACGLIILEFMFNRKAIITTNNGAQPEFIDSGKTGILVDPEDDNSIARNLIELIENKDKLAQIQQAAKEKFDTELSFSQFIDKTIQVYRQALEEN